MNRRALPVAIVMVVIFVLLASAPGTSQQKPKAAGAPQTTTSDWAVQIEPVSAEEGKLPADFAMAIYENLVAEVSKSGKFQQVFRSGDRRATDVEHLLILTAKLEKFERGSSTKRAVTTVGGATKVSVHAQLATRDSQVKLEKTAQGTVRLFGENLKATQALAKNIATLISQATL
jgi:hypothetical protein